MTDDDEPFGREMLSQILAWCILPVMGLASEIGGFIGVMMVVGYLAAVLYREYRLEKAKEASGDPYHWFSKETHALWNSLDTKGKVLFILGRAVSFIIKLALAVVLVVGAFMFVVAWFYSQVP